MSLPPPGGRIPTRISQDAVQQDTVRAALRAQVQRGGMYEALSGSPPATPQSNGSWAADGTFHPYCVCDVDVCDGAAPCAP